MLNFILFSAYDFIIILHLQVNYQTTLAMYIFKIQHAKLFSHSTSISVSWSLTYSESLTFTASNTVVEVGMSPSCYIFLWPNHELYNIIYIAVCCYISECHFLTSTDCSIRVYWSFSIWVRTQNKHLGGATFPFTILILYCCIPF